MATPQVSRGAVWGLREAWPFRAAGAWTDGKDAQGRAGSSSRVERNPEVLNLSGWLLCQ